MQIFLPGIFFQVEILQKIWRKYKIHVPGGHLSYDLVA